MSDHVHAEKERTRGAQLGPWLKEGKKNSGQSSLLRARTKSVHTLDDSELMQRALRARQMGSAQRGLLAPWTSFKETCSVKVEYELSTKCVMFR